MDVETPPRVRRKNYDGGLVEEDGRGPPVKKKTSLPGNMNVT